MAPFKKIITKATKVSTLPAPKETKKTSFDIKNAIISDLEPKGRRTIESELQARNTNYAAFFDGIANCHKTKNRQHAYWSDGTVVLNGNDSLAWAEMGKKAPPDGSHEGKHGHLPRPLMKMPGKLGPNGEKVYGVQNADGNGNCYLFSIAVQKAYEALGGDIDSVVSMLKHSKGEIDFYHEVDKLYK